MGAVVGSTPAFSTLCPTYVAPPYKNIRVYPRIRKICIRSTKRISSGLRNGHLLWTRRRIMEPKVGKGNPSQTQEDRCSWGSRIIQKVCFFKGKFRIARERWGVQIPIAVTLSNCVVHFFNFVGPHKKMWLCGNMASLNTEPWYLWSNSTNWLW